MTPDSEINGRSWAWFNELAWRVTVTYDGHVDRFRNYEKPGSTATKVKRHTPEQVESFSEFLLGGDGKRHLKSLGELKDGPL